MTADLFFFCLSSYLWCRVNSEIEFLRGLDSTIKSENKHMKLYQQFATWHLQVCQFLHPMQYFTIWPGWGGNRVLDLIRPYIMGATFFPIPTAKFVASVLVTWCHLLHTTYISECTTSVHPLSLLNPHCVVQRTTADLKTSTLTNLEILTRTPENHIPDLEIFQVSHTLLWKVSFLN